MLRNLLVPVLIVVGSLLVFSVFLSETDAPKGTFKLTNQHLTWLLDRDGLKFDMEENGPRNISGGINACYATRDVQFEKSGTLQIKQTCTDDEQRTFIDETTGEWSIEDDTLCLNTGSLDREPECWAITYRDGTFEFENEARTVRWYGRVSSQDTESLEHLISGMTQR